MGVLKEAEKRRTFSPVNRPETGQLLWAEKEALLQAAGCLAPGDGVSSPPILMEAVGEKWGCELAHDGVFLRFFFLRFLTSAGLEYMSWLVFPPSYLLAGEPRWRRPRWRRTIRHLYIFALKNVIHGPSLALKSGFDHETGAWYILKFASVYRTEPVAPGG